MKTYLSVTALVFSSLFISCGHAHKPLNPEQEKAADSTVLKRDTIGIDHTKADSISNKKVHKL
jgi:hypothetical protein